MSIYHHLLAKTTTDSVLAKFKSGSWESVDKLGVDFRRICYDRGFPSPDAAFYDDGKKLVVSFEFKPPTETKRGILTGLGQSIAYLKKSHLSYLVIPQTLALEDYPIGSYMTDLFQKQIEENLPIGLIVYENSIPSNVNLVHNVKTLSKIEEFKAIATGRFWAKHQDMPIPLFHLLLQCFYLKMVNNNIDDAFSFCWDHHMFPLRNQKELLTSPVLDIKGDVILTLIQEKPLTYNEKKIPKIKALRGLKRKRAEHAFREKESSKHTGNAGSMSVRKYCLSFMRHIGVIDSENQITEFGIKLYHLGLVNGPRSKVFYDYFIQVILTVGHHLDIIFDLDNLSKQYMGEKTINEIKEELLNIYERKGMVKRNPERRAGDKYTEEFFKFEFILWKSLGLLIKTNGIPETSFNWEKIIEVCSLPDL